jgi:FkbM family methyltransferase
MNDLRSIVKNNPLLTNILSPAIYLRRYLIGNLVIEAKNEVYANLCNILAEDPKIYVDEFDGHFFIDKRSDLFKRLVIHAFYEPELVSYCRQYIDPMRDAIDVGANIGFYSVLFSKKISKTSRILSIEPTNTAFERLKKNLELNDCMSSIILYKGVVSDQVGEIEINTIIGREEYSSIGGMNHPEISGDSYTSYKVSSSTLDVLVDKNNLNPGFLKIDVEGSENLVFKGGLNTIKTYKPVILAEVSNLLLTKNGSSAKEVIHMITNLGYKAINPSSPQLNVSDVHIGDVLFVPD